MFLLISTQKQIVIVPEYVSFLVCLAHHIAIDEALVDLILASRHVTDRLDMGLLVDYVIQFLI